MRTLPTAVLPIFAAAGWIVGRKVPVAPAAPAGHPVAAILGEFGGLNVGEPGLGIECARSDVVFGWSPHEGYEEISEIGDLLETDLACFAEAHNGHQSLYLDREGRVFDVSPVAPGISLVGRSFGEAMERILLGRKGSPLLLPSHDKVYWYGEVLLRGNPQILGIEELRKG
ncbi:SUKH-3 domain-containing protein [Mesorhizobium sp. CO1-1-8]|uniref:SUKH-3 domain-containing protein n=1 Tax=Mesorhizobium sp. CO1-1-8 TaxID=2876631 RepID=UPI001CD12564|nr:SUKH-3 domain-containing protein [Mesorhizobium sp. CO1-1-8]MBZ9776760.1 SUKH-3 domain-containing protein [Mesorhizobium sp. CO1-1-8]